MADTPRGHIERLPSGSFRVDVYGGTDPLTKRRIRFRKTCKDEVTAQIQLGKYAESTATVGQLLDQYLLVGDWDLATRRDALAMEYARGEPTTDIVTPVPNSGRESAREAGVAR
jgi:hypothetical protein